MKNGDTFRFFAVIAAGNLHVCACVMEHKVPLIKVCDTLP